MNKMNVLKENIEKADHDLTFACDDLRLGLKEANSVQAIVLLNLVEDANKLRIKIKNFLDAINLDLPTE